MLYPAAVTTTAITYMCPACHASCPATLTDVDELALRYATCPRCGARNPEGVAGLRRSKRTQASLYLALAVGAWFLRWIAAAVPALDLVAKPWVVANARRQGVAVSVGAVALGVGVDLAFIAVVVLVPRAAPLVPLVNLALLLARKDEWEWAHFGALVHFDEGKGRGEEEMETGKPDASLAEWVEELLRAMEEGGGTLVGFELLDALVACGPPPVVEGWVAALGPALPRCLLWAEIADARRARGDAPGSVAAAVAGAALAALASRHPLPAIHLLRRWGPGAVPAVRAHLESFAVRPGEWFLGAHAALADALASEDPAAAERHLETARSSPPTFPPAAREHASALEAVVVAASLARRLAALGRAEEAANPREVAVERFARGLGSGGFDDRHAHFDLAEEEGIDDSAAVCRVVLELVFSALPPDGDVAPLRVAGDENLAAVLAAAGRLDEARALAEGAPAARAAGVWAAIASSARDESAATAALAEARRTGSPAEVRERHAEGLLSAEERDGILCQLGRAHGRCGRPEEGLTFLAPQIDEAREAALAGSPEMEAAVAAGRDGATVEPSTLFGSVSDRALARARSKGSKVFLSWRLVGAAAGRAGAAGAALLDEALALQVDDDATGSWLAAYAVHGRLADARRLADQTYAQLADREHAHVATDQVAGFILALAVAGRHDEAARELARWLPLPPDRRLLPAVLAVAAHQGTARDLAERIAAALRRLDAGAGAFRL